MSKTPDPAAGGAWSAPVAVDDIPDAGLEIAVEAPAETRAALAQLAGLRELPALSAAFSLSRRGRGVHVFGRVRATVGQTCVVTLDPIENQVDEAVDLEFVPRGASSEPPGENTPEPLIDGKIDLGALATEFLVLGIDPYPRKPGAEFTPPAGEDGKEHPFAALAALKTRPGER
jgi:hypothetical protein